MSCKSSWLLSAVCIYPLTISHLSSRGFCSSSKNNIIYIDMCVLNSFPFWLGKMHRKSSLNSHYFVPSDRRWRWMGGDPLLTCSKHSKSSSLVMILRFRKHFATKSSAADIFFLADKAFISDWQSFSVTAGGILETKNLRASRTQSGRTASWCFRHAHRWSPSEKTRSLFFETQALGV